MARLLLTLALLALVGSACFLEGKPLRGQREDVGPTAEDQLRASDEVMAKLKTFRVEVRNVLAGKPEVAYVLEFQGSDCVRGSSYAPIGGDFVREPLASVAYMKRMEGGLAFGSRSMGAREATNFRQHAGEIVDGRSARVISYQFSVPTIEGPVTVWRKEWLDSQASHLLRQEESNNDRFGDRAVLISTVSMFDEVTPAPCR